MRLISVISLLLFAGVFSDYALGQDIPENSSPSQFNLNGWQCNRGYKKPYNQNRCDPVVIPENASLNYQGNGWQCNRGYKKPYSQNRCDPVVIPENASLNYQGSGWQCNRYYAQRDGKCIHATLATTAEISQLIILDSISGYSGSCPCPWNSDRAGRRCGGRSAYSRAGGYSPLCYANDISEQMVSNFLVRARSR